MAGEPSNIDKKYIQLTGLIESAAKLYSSEGKIVEIVRCGLGKHAKNSDDRTKELRSTESNNGQKFCEQDLLCASAVACIIQQMEDNDIIGDFKNTKVYIILAVNFFFKIYLALSNGLEQVI